MKFAIAFPFYGPYVTQTKVLFSFLSAVYWWKRRIHLSTFLTSSNYLLKNYINKKDLKLQKLLRNSILSFIDSLSSDHKKQLDSSYTYLAMLNSLEPVHNILFINQHYHGTLERYLRWNILAHWYIDIIHMQSLARSQGLKDSEWIYVMKRFVTRSANNCQVFLTSPQINWPQLITKANWWPPFRVKEESFPTMESRTLYASAQTRKHILSILSWLELKFLADRRELCKRFK